MTGMLLNVCSKMARKDPVLAKDSSQKAGLNSSCTQSQSEAQKTKISKWGRKMSQKWHQPLVRAPCLRGSWLTMEEDNRENILVSISQNFCEGFWNYSPRNNKRD